MIWKALSDPTRRSILDLLKNAPRTTGEISDQFNLSRFAIMKHLGILEKAQLIISKKEGKFRWNYLNAKPIQDAYDQWINNLIQLKYYTKDTSPNMASVEKSLQTTAIELVFTIKAKPSEVWKAITNEIDQWWNQNFYTTSATKAFVLEPKLGGLMYEDTGNNEGVVWATVLSIHAPHHLLLKGNLSPDLGGPAISFLKLTLESSQKSTLLRISDTLLGSFSEELIKKLEDNWTQLFGQALKQYIEQG
ncbi:MAG: metalloregulator ArsR/SmtB family transcription factor [Bacteroidota bacterium]